MGVGVHEGTAGYLISRDNEARCIDVRLYFNFILQKLSFIKEEQLIKFWSRSDSR